MNLIEVTTTDAEPPPWQKNVSPLCSAVLDALGVDGWELSVVFCSDRVIRDLNKQYRGKDAATDILSFSQLEGDGAARPDRAAMPAGDLVISLETTDRYCREDGVPLPLQVKRLLIHGILHLHGMDHGERDGQMDGEMIRLQERLLDQLEESLI